jgi:hypothetical protein
MPKKASIAPASHALKGAGIDGERHKHARTERKEYDVRHGTTPVDVRSQTYRQTGSGFDWEGGAAG